MRGRRGENLLTLFGSERIDVRMAFMRLLLELALGAGVQYPLGGYSIRRPS